MALQDCILRLRQSVIYRKWIICSQSKNKTRLTILLDGLSIGAGERTRTNYTAFSIFVHFKSCADELVCVVHNSIDLVNDAVNRGSTAIMHN